VWSRSGVILGMSAEENSPKKLEKFQGTECLEGTHGEPKNREGERSRNAGSLIVPELKMGAAGTRRYRNRKKS